MKGREVAAWEVVTECAMGLVREIEGNIVVG